MNGEERALSAARARAAAPGRREPSAPALPTPGPSHTLGSRGGNALTHYLTSGSSVKLSPPWRPQCESGKYPRPRRREDSPTPRTLNTCARSQHAERRRQRASRRRAPRQAVPARQETGWRWVQSRKPAGVPPGPSAPWTWTQTSRPLAQRPLEGAREAGGRSGGSGPAKARPSAERAPAASSRARRPALDDQLLASAGRVSVSREFKLSWLKHSSRVTQRVRLRGKGTEAEETKGREGRGARAGQLIWGRAGSADPNPRARASTGASVQGTLPQPQVQPRGGCGAMAMPKLSSNSEEAGAHFSSLLRGNDGNLD